MATDDISGASAVGVPTLPPMQTYATNEHGNLVPVNAVSYTRAKASDVDPAIRNSLPKSVDWVTYPAHHPALREGVEINKDGAIKAGNAPTRLLKSGYKQRKREKAPESTADGEGGGLFDELASLEAMEEKIEVTEGLPYQQQAVEQPKVKVCFEMPYADHTVRYHKAELSDRFLVLVYDIRAGDRDELVPKRVDDENGDPKSFPVTVYDEAGKSAKLLACPINLNFEIDTYKFNVLFVTGKGN